MHAGVVSPASAGRYCGESTSGPSGFVASRMNSQEPLDPLQLSRVPPSQSDTSVFHETTTFSGMVMPALARLYSYSPPFLTTVSPTCVCRPPPGGVHVTVNLMLSGSAVVSGSDAVALSTGSLGT